MYGSKHSLTLRRYHNNDAIHKSDETMQVLQKTNDAVNDIGIKICEIS